MENSFCSEAKGDYYRAISIYTEQIQTNSPAPIEAFLGRSFGYMQTKQLSLAESDLSKAFKLAEEDKEKLIDCQVLKALGKVEQGKVQEAVRYLKISRKSLTGKDALEKCQGALSHINEVLSKEKEEFLKAYRDYSEVHLGASWYVVSSSWFGNWQLQVGLTDNDGNEDLPFSFEFSDIQVKDLPIDNSDIIQLAQTKSELKRNPVLISGLQENNDFVLLPKPAFEVLEKRYTCPNPIIRKAIEVNDSIYQVEVFLKVVKIVAPVSTFEIAMMQVSRKMMISDLKSEFLEYQQVSGEFRVWKVNLASISVERLGSICFTENNVYLEGGVLLSEKALVDDSELSADDLILLEPLRGDKYYLSDDASSVQERCRFCQKAEGLNFKCKKCGIAKYCSSKCQREHHREHRSKCKAPVSSMILRCFCRGFSNVEESDDEDPLAMLKEPSSNSRNGLTGLQNLGNTCFMNSALQCLSHTTDLSQYFLQNVFAKHINTSNPLGTKGKLAWAYYEVIQNLWNGNSSSFAPWKLKKVLSHFAPQFVGYQQHDSHELLSFLLDGLHEDLNLIKKKPFYPDDSILEGKSIEEQADICWERHLSRNKSVIVNLMHGQYKSTLLCPLCKNYSYAFDPFSALSLPIFAKSYKKIELFFIPLEGMNTKIACEGSFATVFDLKQHLKKLLSLDHLIIANVKNNSILAHLEDNVPLEPGKIFTLFVYESKPDRFCVEVHIGVKNRIGLQAYPRLVFVKENCTYEKLNERIDKKIKHFKEEDDEYTISHYSFQNAREISQIPSNDETISAFPLKLILRWDSTKSKTSMLKMNQYTDHKREKTPGQKGVDIYDCFRHFSQIEQLDKNNAWYCSHCKQHVEATKQIEIFKVPRILVIQLKRFKVHGYYREKLNTPIRFPEKGLNISEFVIGQSPGLYDLYAVSHHYGGLGGGHYTAQCLSEYKETWVEFNDSHLSEARDLSPSSAYILFYKLRT